MGNFLYFFIAGFIIACIADAIKGIVNASVDNKDKAKSINHYINILKWVMIAYVAFQVERK